MQQNFFTEINAYLQHKDHSLAVRRMLDLALDTRSEPHLRAAIDWSREYRILINNQVAAGLPESFYEKGQQLLKEISSSYHPTATNNESLVEAKDIAKKYLHGNFEMKPASLQVKSGEIIGIVGENGNGKTTLLRCLAGQLALDSGSIHYNLLKNPDYYAIKNYVVFIPQRIPKWYGFLKDNLHFSAAIAGLTGAENELMVDFMLERLDLTQYALLTWDQISSGYRTRFELARILLQKPQLLILDEPLANLDINAQQTILNDLRFITKSAYNPMGILLSSQQLHEVEKVADTVVFIKNGNCMFQQKQSETDTAQQHSHVLEIESKVDREQIVAALQGLEVQIKFNGGFYTIESSSANVQQLLEKIIAAKLPITYFRDISFSTKRYFNK